MKPKDSSFEAFWLHFVKSHQKPGTQWMHTVGVLLGLTGTVTAVMQRRLWPALVGNALFAACAIGAHPLFEGNVPENLGQPLLGILANGRMAWHTLRGTMTEEVQRGLVS